MVYRLLRYFLHAGKVRGDLSTSAEHLGVPRRWVCDETSKTIGDRAKKSFGSNEAYGELASTLGKFVGVSGLATPVRSTVASAFDYSFVFRAVRLTQHRARLNGHAPRASLCQASSLSDWLRCFVRLKHVTCIIVARVVVALS